MNTYLISKRKKELRLTNKDLSEITGLSLSTVSKICSDNFRNPSDETIIKIANALNCSEKELKLNIKDIKYNISKEDEIKEIIIERYGSINKFSKKIGIVPATINRILNEGFDTATFGKISTIFNELNLSLDTLSHKEEYDYSELEKNIILNLKNLNSLGLNKVLIYTQDILKIKEYIKHIEVITVHDTHFKNKNDNINYNTRRARNDKEYDEEEQKLMEEDFENMLKLKNNK